MAASSRSTAPRLGRCCSCSGGPGGRIAHRVLRGADNPSIISANLNPRNGEAVRTKLNVTIRRQALWQDDYRRPDGRAGQAPARTAARTLSGPVVEAWGDVSAPPLSIASSRGPRGASQRAETVSTERRNGSWSERTRPPPRGRNKNAGSVRIMSRPMPLVGAAKLYQRFWRSTSSWARRARRLRCGCTCTCLLPPLLLLRS
jgi:hypothetical protein